MDSASFYFDSDPNNQSQKRDRHFLFFALYLSLNNGSNENHYHLRSHYDWYILWGVKKSSRL